MEATSFKDYFSTQAAAYARYRPGYPAELFDYVASLVPDHEQAWDCGTGSGQAALALTRHFKRVVATDPSRAQIEQAVRHERITYRVEPAERTSLPARSVDLVTVAQAVHWFDLDAFYEEVKRVLKPHGALAVWTYGLPQITPAVDAVVERFYRDVVGPYWPPERRLVEARYRSLPFPFEEVHPPAFRLHAAWNLEALLGFFSTWSATRQFIQQTGADPVDHIRTDVEAAWGEQAEPKPVRWPVWMRVGRLP